VKTTFENSVLGILFAAGLILAGSDGELFPWINVAGVGILGLVTLLANLAHRRARGGNNGPPFLLYDPTAPDGQSKGSFLPELLNRGPFLGKKRNPFGSHVSLIGWPGNFPEITAKKPIDNP
jgi:hypothetical protein